MARTPHLTLIQQMAGLYDLPFVVLEAHVFQESAGRADAFRYEHEYYLRYIKTNSSALGFKYGPLAACSFGLMQIMLETALEIGFSGRPEELFDARVNMTWGVRYLSGLVRWAGGDIEQALAAYNGGKGGNSRRPFRNQPYVTLVMSKRLDPLSDSLRA